MSVTSSATDPVRITFFPNFSATTKREEMLTLHDLADRITTTGAASKSELPWLKLATFGNKPTNKGSLRSNGNLQSCTGLEADYDGGRVTFGDAVAILAEAGIAALIYTSPSHTEDAPRWRVLCQFSEARSPQQRDLYMARLSGVFRGIFALESWTLSQSYYYGFVNGNPSHRVELIGGTAIDLMEELDATAIGRPENPAANGHANERPISSGAGPYVPVSDARLEGFRMAVLDTLRRAAVDGHKHTALRNAALALGGIQAEAGFSDAQGIQWMMDCLPSTVADWSAAMATAAWGLQQGRDKPLALEDRPHSASPPASADGSAVGASRARPPPVTARGNGKDHSNGKDHDAAAAAVEHDPPPKPKSRKRTLNALSLVNFMAGNSDWRGALRVNLFTEAMQVCDQFPPTAPPASAFRPLKEPADLLEAMLYFQGAGFAKAGKALVWDALSVMAHRNAFHPVQEHLNGLRWDGTERLGRLFQDYFNAELPDVNEPSSKPVADKDGPALGTPHDRMVSYLEHISQCFMVSAVARIRRPGCKVDYLPVLVGPQGFHKSQAIRALCADPAWFSDDLSTELMERDTKESLTGKWIVELAEMPHAKKEVERFKAFFSRQTDRYRRAYDRTTNDWPRQCVFCGSSNDLELIDHTGNRRNWPVEIAGPIDIGKIAADRDQLWAEAVVLYEKGYAWWLGAQIENIASEQQGRFQDEDIWTEGLSKWVDGRGPFTLADAMTGALGFPDAKQILKPEQSRAAGCLKSLGYRRRKARTGGRVVPLWIKEKLPRG